MKTFFYDPQMALSDKYSTTLGGARIDVDFKINANNSATAHFIYLGAPDHRSTMQFLVQFADNISLWLPWSRDLSDSIPFGEYCLYIVSLTVSIAPHET